MSELLIMCGRIPMNLYDRPPNKPAAGKAGIPLCWQSGVTGLACRAGPLSI